MRYVMLGTVCRQCVLYLFWTGIQQTGTFTAGDALHIQARMLYGGDMTIDATASDFVLDEIEAYYSSDPEKAVIARMTEQGITNALTLSDVAWNDDFEFTLTSSNSGTFDLTIVCESDAVCASDVLKLLLCGCDSHCDLMRVTADE